MQGTYVTFRAVEKLTMNHIYFDIDPQLHEALDDISTNGRVDS